MSSSLSFAVTPSSHPRSAEERAKILAKPGFGLHFSDHMVAVKWDKETGWHERTIVIDADDTLAFSTAPDPMRRFEVLLPPVVRAAPVGAIFEWRPDNDIITLARRIRDQGGAALIVDYGHVRSDAGDTDQHAYCHENP